ncbi:SRPBCC domain-containing protein [Paracoccaceae bacterium Fryx2]|nr:SRPBCC domain-containing protein [Paracoccaceae bacterium Fryx2]
MQVQGQVNVAVRPPAVVRALHDPVLLQSFLPGGSKVTRTSETVFDFLAMRETAMITLKLPGTLTILELTPRRAYRMTARARHLLGGSLALDLDLTLARIDEATDLSYLGTIEGGGLAGKLLGDHEDAARNRITNMFHEFARRLQRRQPHGEGPAA